MRIIYSQHLKDRLQLRGIEHDLPKSIFEQLHEKYRDEETGYFIATTKVELYGKTREVMVAYSIEGNDAKLLTIHPLKKGQKENRVKAGRWRRL